MSVVKCCSCRKKAAPDSTGVIVSKGRGPLSPFVSREGREAANGSPVRPRLTLCARQSESRDKRETWEETEAETGGAREGAGGEERAVWVRELEDHAQTLSAAMPPSLS